MTEQACHGQRRGTLHDLLQRNAHGHGEEAAQEHQRVQAGVGRWRNEGPVVWLGLFEGAERGTVLSPHTGENRI